MASPAPIVRRRVQIHFAAAKLEQGSRGNKEIEAILNATSFLLPTGEAYFVNSVRNYMDAIKDPVLAEEARRFIFQEVMHSKEHARFNEVLKTMHPYGAEMEKVAIALLKPNQRYFPKAYQLATTCAMEHFTAMFADTILRHRTYLRENYDSGFADLMLWHAMEETEHKAVCFDVFRHVVGKGPFAYLLRVSAMAVVTLSGALALGVGFAIIKWKQRGGARAPGKEAGSPRMRTVGRSTELKLYFDYYRPSFHPWDHKNMHLIEEWKQAYGDFGLRDAADMAVRASGKGAADEAKQPD